MVRDFTLTAEAPALTVLPPITVTAARPEAPAASAAQVVVSQTDLRTAIAPRGS
jgi:hypothetical protein